MRKLCCGRALEERADGVDYTGRVVFPGETWRAANRNRVNFQNDKKYFGEDVKKDDVLGELQREQVQRSPG